MILISQHEPGGKHGDQAARFRPDDCLVVADRSTAQTTLVYLCGRRLAFRGKQVSRVRPTNSARLQPEIALDLVIHVKHACPSRSRMTIGSALSMKTLVMSWHPRLDLLQRQRCVGSKYRIADMARSENDCGSGIHAPSSPAQRALFDLPG